MCALRFRWCSRSKVHGLSARAADTGAGHVLTVRPLSALPGVLSGMGCTPVRVELWTPGAPLQPSHNGAEPLSAPQLSHVMVSSFPPSLPPSDTATAGREGAAVHEAAHPEDHLVCRHTPQVRKRALWCPHSLICMTIDARSWHSFVDISFFFSPHVNLTHLEELHVQGSELHAGSHPRMPGLFFCLLLQEGRWLTSWRCCTRMRRAPCEEGPAPACGCCARPSTQPAPPPLCPQPPAQERLRVGPLHGGAACAGGAGGWG